MFVWSNIGDNSGLNVPLFHFQMQLVHPFEMYRDLFTMYSLRTSTYTKNPSSMLRLPIQTLGRGWSMEGFPKQS